MLQTARVPYGSPYGNAPSNSSSVIFVASVVAETAVHVGWSYNGADYSTPYSPQSVIVNYLPFQQSSMTGVMLMHCVYNGTALALPTLIENALTVRFLCTTSFALCTFASRNTTESCILIHDRLCTCQTTNKQHVSLEHLECLQLGYRLVTTDYYIQQKYGMTASQVVDLFNTCSLSSPGSVSSAASISLQSNAGRATSSFPSIATLSTSSSEAYKASLERILCDMKC